MSPRSIDLKRFGTRARSARAAAAAGSGFVTITDTFTRADSAISLGSTEGANVKVWSALDGTWGISGNKAYPQSGGFLAVVDSTIADGTVSMVFGNAPNFFGLAFRAVDVSNFWIIQCTPTQVFLQKMVAGAQTTVASPAATVASGDTLSVVLSGPSITVKVNTVTVIGPTVDAQFISATKHGLYDGLLLPSPRYDNFSVTLP